MGERSVPCSDVVMFLHEPKVEKSKCSLKIPVFLQMFTQIPVMCRATGRKAGAFKGKWKEFNLKVLNECLKIDML
jgi:hypothetical protein